MSVVDERTRLRRLRPGRVVGQSIVDLWDNNKAAGWEAYYWKDVDDSLHHLLGGTRFILPDAFLPGVEGRENMVVVFPQKTTTVLKIINLIGNKQPKAMRYAMGLNYRSEGMATDVETWLNAVLEFDIDGRPLVPYREISGRMTIEGAVVVKALSTDAHWRKSPSWLDSIDEDEYMDLSDRKRRRYRPEKDVALTDDELDDEERGWSSDSRRSRDRQGGRYMRVDRDGNPVPRSAYHRDKAGRRRDHGYYKGKNKDGTKREWSEDRDATLRAFRRDQKEWLAQRLPFEIEVISARHCIPIFDDNERIIAIVVCRQYDAEDLIEKDFVWGDGLAALVPNPDEGVVVVWELWHTDERDRPYAAYYVDGHEMTMMREVTEEGLEYADAIIDLQKEFGCSRLPIGWFWGLHLPIDDVTRKAVPFLKPVLSSINGAEGLATCYSIYAWRNAFAGSFITVTPEMLERYGDLFFKKSEIFKFTVGPMESAVVPGVPQTTAVPAPGAGLQQLLQMLLQAAAAMSPSEAVFGGDGAPSGHDRALSKEYLEVALSQVLDGARRAMQFISEMILEYAVWIAEKTGRPVPVYANTPIARMSGTGRDKPATDIIELMPSWLKQNTRVHCYYEADDTDELTRQQLAQQHMQGLVPWDDYRRLAWNDPNPLYTLVKIFGDQAIRTPEGRQDILEFASELRADEQEQEKQELIKEGLLSEDGVPTAARVPFTPKRLLNGEGGSDGADTAALAALATGRPSLDPMKALRGGMERPQATLPPGVEPPPGVPPDLLARHLQLDRSHAAARAAAAPTGPLGAIGGLANGRPLPVPGAGPGGPQGPSVVLGRPPDMPPGVDGPADIHPFPPQFAAAPGLPGVNTGGLGPNDIANALGGVLAGQLRKAAKRFHAKRRGPRVDSGR